MLSISYIQSFAAAHADLVYLLIVIGVFLEGEIMVIIAGVFSHLGSINIFYALLATVIGGVTKSVVGYSFGYYLQKNFSQNEFLAQAENRVNSFFPNFLKRPFLSMYLSRFLILGMYWFTLIYSGYKKIKIKTFIKAEATSLLSWAIIMLSLGYFFSYTALSISREVQNFLAIMLLFFIMFFVLEKIISFAIEIFEMWFYNK